MAKYLEYRFEGDEKLSDVVELDKLPPQARRMGPWDVWVYGRYGVKWAKIKPIDKDYDFGTGIRTLADYCMHEYALAPEDKEG